MFVWDLSYAAYTKAGSPIEIDVLFPCSFSVAKIKFPIDSAQMI